MGKTNNQRLFQKGKEKQKQRKTFCNSENFLKTLKFPKSEKEKREILKSEKSKSFQVKEKQLKKALKNPGKVITSKNYNLFNCKAGKTNLLYKKLEKEILFQKGIGKKEKLERIERLESEKNRKLEREKILIKTGIEKVKAGKHFKTIAKMEMVNKGKHFKSLQSEKNFLLNNISKENQKGKLGKMISRLEYIERKKRKFFESL